MQLKRIETALSSIGLISRGAFHPNLEDGVPPLPDGRAVATVVLAGNVGGDARWQAFQQTRSSLQGPHPLNRWTREALSAVGSQLGAHVWFPFDGPPYLPFQRWAQRTEPVTPSPIGPLIHPDYGLWHAYRGALAFAAPIALPAPDKRPSPCETCADKPCLSTCPVDALKPQGLDLDACLDHIASDAGSACLGGGCLARRACPVGQQYRYAPAQARFHMEAFLRNAKKAVTGD
ncbi:MAG: hypothetical protein ACE5LB_05100 [Acidiferrobacterales bacterium]